jgi:putative flippase GtrA
LTFFVATKAHLLRLGEPVAKKFVLIELTSFFCGRTQFMINRPTTEERLSQTASSKLLRYFLVFMTLVYMGLGVALWVLPPHVLNLAMTTRRILGGVFVIYGIIRFVRIYRQHFQSSSSSHERTLR